MTTIEWTEETFNPIRARNKATGGVGHFCVHASPGCKNCYAESLQPRYRNHIRYAAQDLEKVELFLDREVLERPLRWKRPRRIFPCSMTDLFGEFVHGDWIDAIIDVMRRTPQHTYQVLTKRADRMWRFMRHYGPLPNVWMGVSVEDQQRADERIPDLLKTPAGKRWLSIEPLLGEVDIKPYLAPLDFDRIPGRGDGFCYPFTGIEWVVVGGESGRKARRLQTPWVQKIVEQCHAADVAVFVKQLGQCPIVSIDGSEGMRLGIKLNHPKGGDPEEWPVALRVREYPK